MERPALSDTAAAATLIEVRLLELSLTDFAESSAHHAELFREFALILNCEPSPRQELPGRLLAVVEELTERFGGFTAAPQGELQAALERGDATIDLTFHVPAQVKEAALRLGELLAAADRYCQEGELLTVAPPAGAVRFRDWYLREFVAQIDGEPPTPWPAYRG